MTLLFVIVSDVTAMNNRLFSCVAVFIECYSWACCKTVGNVFRAETVKKFKYGVILSFCITRSKKVLLICVK